MQRRSPPTVFGHGLLTLGLYNFVWFAKTRRELMTETGLSIPSIFWPIVASLLAAGALVAALVIFAVTPNNSSDTSKPASVSRACWAEYVLSQAPETAAANQLSADCQNQVQLAQAAPKVVVRDATAAKRALLLVLVAFVAYALYVWWALKYARAVERVTGGRVNQSVALLFLTVLPYGIPMLQSAFNNPQQLPDWMGAFEAGQVKQWFRFSPSVERGPVKSVLRVVAIVLAIVLVMLLALMFVTLH